MTSYKELRQQHIELLEGMIPEHLERLSWSRHQIDAERQARLRELIGIAKEQSPWHAKRLTHITADTITEADLVQVDDPRYPSPLYQHILGRCVSQECLGFYAREVLSEPDKFSFQLAGVLVIEDPVLTYSLH